MRKYILLAFICSFYVINIYSYNANQGEMVLPLTHTQVPVPMTAFDGSSFWGGDKSGSDRYNLGMKYAKEHYSDLIYNLGEDEPIHIVTHSEGAAYGAGIAQYLINQGIKVKTVLHLSADEGDEFSTPKEPYTIQFSYDKDWITGNHFINGSDIQIINKMYNGVDGSWQYVHGQTNNRSVFDLIEKALRENDSEKDKIIYSY